MAAPEPQAPGHRWARWREDLGILLWTSFLTAAFATMIFFAFFDPLTLADDAVPPSWLADRMSGYAIGFFFFWLVCTLSSLLTAWLIDTRNDGQRSPHVDVNRHDASP